MEKVAEKRMFRKAGYAIRTRLCSPNTLFRFRASARQVIQKASQNGASGHPKSQKIKNLQRDNRISCLLEDGLVYEKLRGVQINGVAELVDSPDKVHQLAKGVMARNNPEIPSEALDEVAKAMSVKRTAVIVKATKVVSWDHQKLGGTY